MVEKLFLANFIDWLQSLCVLFEWTILRRRLMLDCLWVFPAQDEFKCREIVSWLVWLWGFDRWLWWWLKHIVLILDIGCWLNIFCFFSFEKFLGIYAKLFTESDTVLLNLFVESGVVEQGSNTENLAWAYIAKVLLVQLDFGVLLLTIFRAITVGFLFLSCTETSELFCDLLLVELCQTLFLHEALAWTNRTKWNMVFKP